MSMGGGKGGGGSGIDAGPSSFMRGLQQRVGGGDAASNPGMFDNQLANSFQQMWQQAQEQQEQQRLYQNPFWWDN